jgi:hypothetical protein
MEAAQLTVGRSYAYREKRQPRQPILRVTLLALVGRGGRVQVRFEDGEFPGLVDYAHTRQLIIPWGDRKALLRDEERMEQIKKTERGGGVDKAVQVAIEAVLTSTGEDSVWLTAHGLEGPVDAVERIMRRAKLQGGPTALHPLAFVDRFGTVHVPTFGAEALARAFASCEPESVAMYLEGEESKMRAKGYAPGDRFYHDCLREQRPGFAVARQWAGFDQELESLQKEISRLRDLLLRAVHQLDAAGATTESWKLRRALEGG